MPPANICPAQSLMDAWGRVHTNLRISVTDRCNIRCFYCMPAENVRFKPRHELLTFEEIERFVRVGGSAGNRQSAAHRRRTTGAADLPRLVDAAGRASTGIRDLALTTNGILLAEQARRLATGRTARVNISLDCTRAKTFFSRFRADEGLDRVLAGIAAAQQVGFRTDPAERRGDSRPDPNRRSCRWATLPASMTWKCGSSSSCRWTPTQQWHHDQVLTVRSDPTTDRGEFGPLVPARAAIPASRPSTSNSPMAAGAIGFINPVTEPFCHDCNRLRLTAEGQVRNCLFSTEEWDAAASCSARVLRRRSFAQLVRDCVEHKKPGHGIDSPAFQRPARAMYQIGG